MKALTLILPAVALAACTSLPVGSKTSPTAAIGETAYVGGLRVQPVELLEDSRCPASVQCIWAGRVRVLVDITRGDGAHQQRDLTLGEPQNIDWGWMTLLGVIPSKQVPGSIDPRTYRFTFRLAPGP